MSPEAVAVSPYPGPRPFQPNEQEVFFGRDQETRELVSLLFAHRLLFLYAQSGAGKTSLLNAGVIPALRKEQFDVLPVVRVGVPTGQSDRPARNVFVWNTLAGWQEGHPPGGREQTLAQSLTRREPVLDEQKLPLPKVVIFDQFEEIFTSFPERWREREAWFEQMAEALEQDQGLRVVFVLREEFLASLDSCEGILPERPATRYRLERLRQDAAIEAIERPLEGTSRTFARGVAEALANKLLAIRTVTPEGRVTEAPGEFIEPVQLQVVCRSLWDSLPPGVNEITESHLTDFGDVNEALMDFYENAVVAVCRSGSLTEGEVRNWFERTLLTPALTRGTVFRGAATTGGIPNSVVKRLEELHVIRGEMRAGAYWYELTHDRLVEPILQSNRAWRAQLSQAEQMRDFLDSRAMQWAAAGRDHQRLLNDLELAEAERWLNGPGGREAGESVLMLVTASREDRQRKEALQAQEQAREQARIARRFRKMAISLGVASLLAVASLFFAMKLWSQAEENARRAVSAEQVAKQNAADARREKLKAEDEEKKAEAARDRADQGFRDMKEARDQADHFRRQADIEKQRALANLGDANTQRDRANQLAGQLADKAKLAEQRQVEADQLRGKAQEDAEQAKRLAAFASSGESASDALSELQVDPERSLLVGLHAAYETYGPYGTVTEKAADILNRSLQESRVKLSMEGAEDAVVSAAFSPDGRFIASGTYLHEARLWDAATGRQLRVFRGKDDEHVRGIAFSPNGRSLATATGDKVIKLWDVTTGELLRTFSGHEGEVIDVAFNADGTQLASGAADKKAFIWDVASGRPLRRFEDNAAIRSVAFSPDGKRLATGSWAQSDNVRLWDLETGGSKIFSGHRGSIYGVAFSPDGRTLASASTDYTAKLWDTATGNVKYTLSGHAKGVWGVAFNSAGDRLATASEDHTVRIWDPGSGNLLLTMPGHAREVRTVAFSPDGRRLVTGSFDKTLRVWDLTTGRALPVLSAHKAVWSLAFSRDGKRIATAGEDGSLQLWNAASGEIVREFSGQDGVLTGVAFSPDDHRLASVSLGKTAKIWDVDSGAELISLSGASLAKAAYSPDGKFIAAANRDGHVEIWDVASGTKISLSDVSNSGWGISFSGDGQLLAAAGQHDTVKIWDFAARRELQSLAAPSEVWGVSFSPDGRLVAATGVLDGPWIWELSGGGARRSPLPAPKGQVAGCIGVAFSPDGRHVAAGCKDTARIWDALGRRLLLSLPHKGQVWDVAFSPDGRWLATAGEDKVARIWDAASGKLVREFTGHTDFIFGAAFSPDGKLLVTASRDESAIIWDALSGRLMRQLKQHSSSVIGLAFNPRRTSELLTSSLDGNVIIWDTHANDPVKTLSQPVSSLKAVAFSNDGKSFATAGAEDHSARIWDSASGTMLREFNKHTDYVDSVAFSPDGRRLVTVGGDKAVKLWDTASGAMLKEYTGHEGPVVGVAFSPDGRHVATASDDGTARVWDPDSGTVVRFAGHTGGVAAVAFSPDGKLVASGSEDKTIKVWRAGTGEEVNSFSGPQGKVSSLAFNRDGSRLAAGSLDGTVRIYAIQPEQLMILARRHISRGLTESECAAYLRSQAGRCGAFSTIAEGNRLARMGDVDRAAGAFQKAQQQLAPHLLFDSHQEAQQIWAASQQESKQTAVLGPINFGRQLVRAGEVTLAIQSYRDALQADPSVTMTAADANTFCWWGSLWGHAPEVMTYCELAVRLEPDNASYKDSRGLARALTGHMQEAIGDFAAFIERTPNFDSRRQRMRWVDQISAGKNPFTPEEIQGLRRR